MKKVLKISVLTLVMLFMVNCTKDESTDDSGSSGGAIPSAGWRIGTTNYTTVFTMKNVGQPNSIAAFDRIPGLEDVNSVIILFNNKTGIAAGTFKTVIKPNQEDLLANEIMISMGTGYSQNTGKYLKDYVSAVDKSVNAVVTITGGKVKVVIPEIEIYSLPLNASSTKTTFAGTIIEK
jgi:hypothetical protein